MNLPLFLAYTDGASRGNPGPSGAGAVLVLPDKNKVNLFQFIDVRTNNEAEYMALILALEELVKRQAKNVCLFADSELMIRQLNGIYKVKHQKILSLFQQAQKLIKQIAKIEFKHIYREQNTEADALANLAIDEHHQKL